MKKEQKRKWNEEIQKRNMLLRIFMQSKNRHFVKIKIFRYKFKSRCQG